MSKRVVRALYDYAGSSEDASLAFRKGDVIQVLTQLETGWWDGLWNGQRGWFPSNYVGEVEVVRDAPTSEQEKTGLWVRQIGDLGTVYYFNRKTGTTTTETPQMFAPEPSEISGEGRNSGNYNNTAKLLDLPDGWIVFEAETGGPVYYNSYTRETRWTRPNNGQQLDNESVSTISPASSAPISAGPLSASSSNGSFSRESMRSRTESESHPRNSHHQLEGMPPNWGRKLTGDGRPYYYNMLTDETTWTLDDVDPETGALLAKIHRRKASDSSAVSERSSTGSQSSNSAPVSPAVPDIDASGQGITWSKLTADIGQAVYQLNYSAKFGQKEKFIPQSSSIVESIRIMLYASGTARKDAPLVASHKMLKMHHRHIMSSLSKLVLFAKLASGVWPPPDAVYKMQQAANEVLLAVRHFVAAAQEAGVPVRAADVINGVENAVAAAEAMLAQSHDSAVSSLDGNDDSRHNSLSSDGSLQATDQQLSVQQTNSELIAQLEKFTRSIAKMLSDMVTAVRSDQMESSTLITQVKVTVMEVGQFLALVEEIPLDYLSDDLTVDFKVNRLSLYNSVTGLVNAISTATKPLPPSNASELVVLSTGLLEKSVKDLLISTKFLIEEKESVEQVTLQNYIEQYGQQRRSSEGGLVRPRRAASLSILGPGSLGALPENGEGDRNSGGYTLPSYSEEEDGRPLFSRSMSSAASIPSVTSTRDASSDSPEPGRRPSKNGSKIQQILGDEAPESPTVQSHPAQLVAKPRFLDYDYAPEDLIFNMEGKVKGGTLEALVERLTLHDTLDADFLLAFLLTYRSFTNSIELISLLTRRYSIQPPADLPIEDREQWVEKKQTPIRLRVFNVLKNWIETYAMDDDATDRIALATVKRFAQETVAQSMPGPSAQLIRLVEKRESGSGSARKMVLNSNREFPTPVVPRNLNKIKFLDLDTTEVARQLTIMESKQYNKIMPGEFLKKAWSEKDGNAAVNVKAMITMSNQITGWVAASILNERDPKKRAQIMKHFIYIADRCRALNNFNTLMSVLAGLNSAPIHRLKRTWEVISQRSHSMLEALRNTMTPTRNFSAYRDALHSANPPCVPFLGFYLTDLTFVEDGNPDMVKGSPHLVNFAKRLKTAEVLREIQQYQNVPYVLMPVPEIQGWLKMGLSNPVEDNDLYNTSLELEPREREDEKIARLLQESGFL
ncbi:hypothetical protein PhCBS80983_g05847 [Powellomyces hirtus]|uniref:Ras GEF n=1 Tax=Powellomyces hirtus TaxID=109895 RepID=A0A507DSI6_9FUNG|nr:hypothetical protein PhCBS80983_g05847 [Powellomyces hirtus]